MIFQSFDIQPIGPEADARTWILWNRDSGSHLLDASQRRDRRRIALIRTSTGPAFASPVVGAKLQLPHQSATVSAPLPLDAPLAGPELCEAAIAAIRQQFEPGPLAMREGCSRDELAKLIQAIKFLVVEYAIGHLPPLICNQDPTVPIEKTVSLDLRPIDPIDVLSLVMNDVARWYGLRCVVPGNPWAYGLDRGGKHFARLEVSLLNAGIDRCSSEAQAVASIVGFYDGAAPRLGLSSQELNLRLGVFRISRDGSEPERLKPRRPVRSLDRRR